MDGTLWTVLEAGALFVMIVGAYWIGWCIRGERRPEPNDFNPEADRWDPDL